eukprot:scaffold1462_cov64-Cyclotella_meneghiniana.AAC.8
MLTDANGMKNNQAGGEKVLEYGDKLSTFDSMINGTDLVRMVIMPELGTATSRLMRHHPFSQNSNLSSMKNNFNLN